jgi:(S)-ureidoglycine aminohydrolase
MIPKLGLTRNVLRGNYALITRDGYVASVLPGWTNCVSYVLISEAMGAGLVQLLIDMEKGGRGLCQTGSKEWFIYVVTGRATLNKKPQKTGSYAYVPSGSSIDISSAAKGTRILVFKKSYEPLDSGEAPPVLISHEDDVTETPFLGDVHARLKTLLPDLPAMDMAVNIFTYDPGATLPFVETHIMEHGMLFLDGSGVYRLDEEWHPVQAGDAIWIAPYCPQWFIAAGPEPARYIYYKNVNRTPR